jgi:hypothetical protein
MANFQIFAGFDVLETLLKKIWIIMGKFILLILQSKVSKKSIERNQSTSYLKLFRNLPFYVNGLTN